MHSSVCQNCITKGVKTEARTFGIGNDRQDESYSILTGLLRDGYTTVTWHNNEASCSTCQGLDGYTWSLDEFLYDSDGAIYRKSHPNCLCWVEVSHPNGDIVRVNAQGEM